MFTLLADQQSIASFVLETYFINRTHRVQKYNLSFRFCRTWPHVRQTIGFDNICRKVVLFLRYMYVIVIVVKYSYQR